MQVFLQGGCAWAVEHAYLPYINIFILRCRTLYTRTAYVISRGVLSSRLMILEVKRSLYIGTIITRQFVHGVNRPLGVLYTADIVNITSERKRSKKSRVIGSRDLLRIRW